MDKEKFYKKGSRNAFVSTIYKLHHEKLLLHAIGLCNKHGYSFFDAEDLMQELYRKALQSFEVTEAGYATHGIRYLMGILRNELYGMNRKRKSISRLGGIYYDSVPKTGELDGLATGPLVRMFQEMIAPYLSEKDARIMKLYVEGYSHEEIGQMLGMKPSTAGVRIHRAKKTLAPHFEGWWRKRKPRIH